MCRFVRRRSSQIILYLYFIFLLYFIFFFQYDYKKPFDQPLPLLKLTSTSTKISEHPIIVTSKPTSSYFPRHIIAKQPKQPKDGVMTPALLWNDAKCRRLVGKIFDEIKHGPYKADLCRLHVLYKYGGLYTDDDIWLYSSFIEPHLTVVQECSKFKDNKNQIGYFNAFISARKKIPQFLLQLTSRTKRTTKLFREKNMIIQKRLEHFGDQ